jgi:hypothetical protein
MELPLNPKRERRRPYGDNTGRELLMPRLERQLAKNTIERQMIVLASAPASRN